jgi:opacity protein-like surface antigen
VNERRTRRRIAIAAGAAIAASSGPAVPEPARSLNFYGVPGLIDMPSGEAAQDAQLATTISNFAGMTRTTLTFQLSERLSGSFRYARFADWNFDGFDTYYDRSFDLRFRLLDESQYLPSLTVGMQDFLGTGVSSAEYIVATKTFGERLKLTAGLGWGRLGSYGSIGSLGARPAERADETGGTPNTGQWFRGPYAPFAGLEYQFNDRLTLKAEYSSDNYELEAGARGLFERKSPFNFGAEYKVSDRLRLGGYYLYGSTLGFSANVILNPKTPANPGTTAGAPLPVKPRDRLAAESWGTDWAADRTTTAQIRQVTAKAMANEGLLLEHMAITGTSAEIRIRNGRYDAEPMAIGRALRALTYILPPSVETLTVVPVVNGIPASAISIRRSDLERFENTPDGTERILAAAAITDRTAPARRSDMAEGVYPRFSYQIAPAASLSFFDPRSPVIYDIGIRAKARYEVAPGLILSGSIVQRITGNYNSSDRESDSVLPHVRSDALKYRQQGGTAIEHLTASYYFRPGPDLYGRVTAGYLERMFGGVSAELLWKPVDSDLALGVDANWVKQRAFDGGFGFRDYSVATGHLSAYYTFGNGYLASVRAGRYLAGDWGATVALDREFANGWKVGAFATLTDVSFEDFGEGSFDKGIHLEIPISWVLGNPTRASAGVTLRPLTRDGGAMLNGDGGLYDSVRDYHSQGLSREWGLFWR